MIKLKDLLKFDSRIRIVVEDEDYKSFLEYAKEEGCLWQSGKIINPNKNETSIYTRVIVIRDNLLIYHPSGWISHASISTCPKYLYKDLKVNIVIDEKKKSKRTIKNDEEYKLLEEARILAFKKKCLENRELSKLQIKYHDITSKLQKNFFVRYENHDDLLKLFLLFKKYGYENIYDIAIDNFFNDPKVICLDNEELTFYPASISSCSIALLTNKKFYKTDDFIKIINDIFKN